MRKPHRAMSLALFVAAIFGSTSAYCDMSKTFSFENQDKFNVGPLRIYVESSHCIAEPEVTLSQFGTAKAPRVLGAKEQAKAIVRPASSVSECVEDGAARFTLRFAEGGLPGSQGEVSDSPQRMTSVTFTLGKNNILDIDNQGTGGFSIAEIGSKSTRHTEPSYAIDWQSLEASRKDVIYNRKGQMEATLECMNQTRRACKGTLHVSSRLANEGAGGNGASEILAKGTYKIPYSKVKSVPLNTTKAGRRLLTREHIIGSTGSSYDVSLNAKPSGSGQMLSLATINIPTIPAAVQVAQLNLHVTNNSSSTTSACLFQQSQQQGTYSVVWFSRPMAPGTRVSFTWSNNDYSFVWAETGRLVPGIIFDTSQVISSAIGNQITFFLDSYGAAQFTNLTPDPLQPNNLSINSTTSVNPGHYAVGVGLSGSPVYVAQAQPNMTYQFPPPSNSIYVFAGNCETGEVLDIPTIWNAAEINFSGQTRANATLQMDGTWTVTTGDGL